MKFFKTFFIYVALFLIPAIASAYSPQATNNTYGLFVAGSGYELPSTYFQQQTLSKYEGGSDNYVLKTTPINMSGGTYIQQTSQWRSSQLTQYPGSSWYKEYVAGFPSFTELYGNQGQCVAFAKAMTQDTNGAVATWKASDYVIPQVSQWYYSDISSQYAGKMVAYFGNNVPIGTGYPPNSYTSTGHVGIFLKYAYTQELVPGTLYYRYRIIGFWIADENYEGTANSNNPDGKIRKHLILINPIPNGNGTRLAHTYAGQYRFVNI